MEFGFGSPLPCRHDPSKMLGASAHIPANTSRSMLEKTKRPGDLRRSTFSWCRSTRISASRAARERKSPTNAHQMSLQRSIIAREHQPIRARLPAGLGSRQGQRSCSRRRIESDKEAVEPKGWLEGFIPERTPVRPPVLCSASASPKSIKTELPTCKTLRIPDRSTSDSYQPAFALARASDGAPDRLCDKSQSWPGF